MCASSKPGWSPILQRKLQSNCLMGDDPISHRVTTGLFYNRTQRYICTRKVSIHISFNLITLFLQLRNIYYRTVNLLSNQGENILLTALVVQIMLLMCGDVEANPGPNTCHSISILHLNIRSIRQN